MGGSSVALAANYWTSNTEPAGAGGVGDADVDGYSVSGQVGVNNMKFGGRYTKHNDRQGRGLDLINWRVGADYAMGDWSYGVTYQKAAQDRATGSEDESVYWSIGASYTVGPGIQFGGGIVGFSYDDDAGNAAAEGENNFGILWSKFSF